MRVGSRRRQGSAQPVLTGSTRSRSLGRWRVGIGRGARRAPRGAVPQRWVAAHRSGRALDQYAAPDLRRVVAAVHTGRRPSRQLHSRTGARPARPAARAVPQPVANTAVRRDRPGVGGTGFALDAPGATAVHRRPLRDMQRQPAPGHARSTRCRVPCGSWCTRSPSRAEHRRSRCCHRHRHDRKRCRR